ncbi:hypothetical protein JNM87_01820 [Candidatus Saccharibacteria bacterium]|nr:hypothetical protein [Candidatus Saccharibacteria bacterium]
MRRLVNLVFRHTHPFGSRPLETALMHSASSRRNYGFVSKLSKHMSTISNGRSSRTFKCDGVLVATLLVLGAIIAQPLVMPTAVQAAPNQSTGITVSPALVTLTVTKDSPESQATVSIANAYDTDIRLSAELRSIDEMGARLIPSGRISSDLEKTLRVSADELTVPAKGVSTLDLIGQNSAVLSPGGHYATLVLTELSSSQNGSVFHGAIAVNVFFIQADGVKRDIRLTSIQAREHVFSLPSSITLAFRNGGNMHIVPRASVSYYDGDTLLARAVINENSAMLFPDREKAFSAPVTYLERSVLPRHITRQIMYRIDGTDVQLIQKKSFWYVPIADMLVLFLVILLSWWQRRRLGRWIIRPVFRAIRWLARTMPLPQISGRIIQSKRTKQQDETSVLIVPKNRDKDQKNQTTKKSKSASKK